MMITGQHQATQAVRSSPLIKFRPHFLAGPCSGFAVFSIEKCKGIFPVGTEYATYDLALAYLANDIRHSLVYCEMNGLCEAYICSKTFDANNKRI